jgi:hypothetical protein
MALRERRRRAIQSAGTLLSGRGGWHLLAAAQGVFDTEEKKIK